MDWQEDTQRPPRPERTPAERLAWHKLALGKIQAQIAEAPETASDYATCIAVLTQGITRLEQSVSAHEGTRSALG
jgi:hypothetical protein